MSILEIWLLMFAVCRCPLTWLSTLRRWTAWALWGRRKNILCHRQKIFCAWDKIYCVLRLLDAIRTCGLSNSIRWVSTVSAGCLRASLLPLCTKLETPDCNDHYFTIMIDKPAMLHTLRLTSAWLILILSCRIIKDHKTTFHFCVLSPRAAHNPSIFTIKEKAPIRSFSWLQTLSSQDTFKTLC